METSKPLVQFQQVFSIIVPRKQSKALIRQNAKALDIAVFKLAHQPKRLYFRCTAKQWEQFCRETKHLGCIESPVLKPHSGRNGKSKKDRPLSRVEIRMFRLLVAGANVKKRTQPQAYAPLDKPCAGKARPVNHAKRYSNQGVS